MYLRLPTSLAVIFGSFTLGLYVAIQGPTLMDLIDLLHVNQDIMSFTLAFASLAYSVGGLLSGFLFNYLDRQILIAIFLTIFGISNILTPFMSNYIVFSVITVFKMMCAGGTDCGNNVWILEMWPGKDAWLQALHFSFAVGCALGPLIVEPFLSVEYSEKEMKELNGKTTGTATINDQNTSNESLIYIPYAVSGLTSIFAAIWIIYLYVLAERRKAELAKLLSKQQGADGEHILLNAVQHPAAIEAGRCMTPLPEQQHQQPLALTPAPSPPPSTAKPSQVAPAELDRLGRACEQEALVGPAPGTSASTSDVVAVQRRPSKSISRASPAPSPQHGEPAEREPLRGPQGGTLSLANSPEPAATPPPAPVQRVKITSKVRDTQSVGRPPYYVMFAIALAAMCLSFYCGIEITSMNYLATFAVNIDLQISKSTAAYMSSALTISFAIGRGVGIWVAAYMKPAKLFYMCAVVMALGNVFMLVFANRAETLLWYSICVFGIGCGPMFPAIVSFYDDRIAKVTNTVSGIFILGSMFNVAMNSVIIGHQIIENALILIVCNLIGSVVLLMLFGTLHLLTKVKKYQRVKKYKLKERMAAEGLLEQQKQQQQLLLQAQQVSPQQVQQEQLDEGPESTMAIVTAPTTSAQRLDSIKGQEASPVKPHDSSQ